MRSIQNESVFISINLNTSNKMNKMNKEELLEENYKLILKNLMLFQV